MNPQNEIYYVPEEVLAGDLKVGGILSQLTEKEKKYATYLHLSAFAMFPILADSLSKESLSIHAFLSAYLLSIKPSDAHTAIINPTEENRIFRQLINYSAVFYLNSSNYLGFGDTKFIPRMTQEELHTFISKTSPTILPLLDNCIESMFSLEPESIRSLGFSPHGVTQYYKPETLLQDEAKAVTEAISKVGIRPENTTIVKTSSRYEIHVYSIEKGEKQICEYNGIPIFLIKGKHSEDLSKSVSWLHKARNYCANEIQEQMIDSLISHYTTGKVEDHVKYSSLWVQDVNPTIETHLGFIETYHDPLGIRAEFEGLISAVDKKASEILHKFVDASKIILSLLPYPKEYERINFKPPSYNALSVISYCVSDYPIGINIPNYDEVRLKVGFKNVTLINVMAAYQSKTYQFYPENLIPIIDNFSDQIRTIHVACHELYGHGSGTLLTKSDIEKGIPDLLTPNHNVTTYYKEGETYDGKFGLFGQSFEECRAECTAIYLILHNEVLNIFKVDPINQKDMMLVEIYNMSRSGLYGLRDYEPSQLRWRQAHSQGRFAILKAILMWGKGALQIKKVDNDVGYEIFVDKERINDLIDGYTIMLKHLNYYKATAQVESAQAFFQSLTSVDNFFLGVRDSVLKFKRKKMVFQGALCIQNEKNEYDLVEASEIFDQTPTPFDFALTLAKNIKIATEN